MNTSSSISLIIPTYRRPRSLTRVMDGVALQRDPGVPWEVIVVDNDPAASAASTIELIREKFPAPLTFVVEPRPGAGNARNRGMSLANGWITVFIDDDVVPEPEWLRELVTPILEGACQATGGRVTLDPDVPRPSWFDENRIGGYLSRFDLGPNVEPIRADGYVLTANAAFLTRPLRATGGFDERLGPRGRNPLVCDDNLITRRFLAIGARILYVPTALVVHELPLERLTPQYLVRRAYAQGRSDWLLLDVLDELTRFSGLRVGFGWLQNELPCRVHEGLLERSVALHALTDLARAAGALREVVVRAGTSSRSRNVGTTSSPFDPELIGSRIGP